MGGSQDMSRAEAVWEEDDERDSRRRCRHCREFFEADDRRAVCVLGREQGMVEHFCCTECLSEARRQEAGGDVTPYYGDQLEDGFRALDAAHGTDW